MPSYVVLFNWTDQGIHDFKDTVGRATAARELAGKLGGTLKDIYWTVGPYDIVAITEAPDDESMTAVMLAIGAQGNVRTTTLRAFNAEEMAGIIEKAG